MRLRFAPLACFVFIVVGFVCIPRVTSAQSVISGQVKDQSGAVLPGVTAEATSPVLIERT